MKLEELDLSNKRVKIGSLDVIQSLSGSAITNITTALEATKGSTYVLSGDTKAFINKMLDDGLISPDEKKQLRRELSSIQTEFPVIKADALLAGVPEFSEVMTLFVSAYNNLYSYLYTELKVFDNMSDFTTVALRSEFESTFVAYYSSRDALKKAITDGLILKVVEDVSADILATNEKIEEVRLGDIIDGAIKRASLETGVRHEMEMVTSSLFPNGLERQGTFEFLTPRVAISEDMVDYLLSLVTEQEEVAEIRANEIRLISAINDEVSSRMASLEINFDSITQVVAEIAPLPDGQIANLTQITQTADSLDLLATTGRYNSGGGEIDSFSIAQMKILADRFALFVGGAGDDFDSAQWMVRQDQISGIVQNAIETDTELVASISQMVQGAESVQFQVAQLKTETIERIDDALTIAQAGMLISATEITLGVQNLEEEIQSLLKVKSDQITALVQDTRSLSASILSLKSEQIDAIVSGGGATASLAMAVTLPSMIDATTFNLMSRAVGSDPVSAVYALTSGGFWTVRADSTIFAQKTLKNGLRDAGLLGSQIILDADEILLGGKVMAKNIDVESLNVAGSIRVGPLQMTGLGELATKDRVGVGNCDYTLIEGGKIKTGLLLVDEILGESAVFRGSLQAASGTFSGSIESGPLKLNISPPANYYFSTTNQLVVNFINSLLSAGIRQGRYICSGTYNGTPLSAVSFTIEHSVVAVPSAENYHYEWYTRDNWSEYKSSRYKNVWNGVKQKRLYKIIFYTNNNGQIINETIEESIYEPITWSLVSTTYIDYKMVRETESPYKPTAPASPRPPVPAVLCAAGNVSFTASAFTMQLINLPAYSATLLPWATYLEADGAGNYNLKVKG